ncbi:26S proteasome non-ATPase regulatory subunit 3 [Spatholobus suberectus]|nr:26S proteasome non-ATPase regulatory subunit 3 [Spatholobus suberectus]
MSEDVEMKDQATPSHSVSSVLPSTLHHLKKIASIIETSSYSKEVRQIARALRLTFALRRKLMTTVLSSFLDYVLAPASEPHTRLSSYLPNPKEGDPEMEVDTASSAIQTPAAKHLLPELEIYCYLLVLLFLIDQKRYDAAKACSLASIVRLKSLNRRTVDVIASRLYVYYSYSYELTGDLAEI